MHSASLPRSARASSLYLDSQIFFSLVVILRDKHPNRTFLFCLPEWSQWTSCSQSCGSGSRSRRRECKGENKLCSGGDDQQLEACQQEVCPGESSQVNTICNKNSRADMYIQHSGCVQYFSPVDGSWLSWGEWSSCTTTCGLGTRCTFCLAIIASSI